MTHGCYEAPFRTEKVLRSTFSQKVLRSIISYRAHFLQKRSLDAPFLIRKAPKKSIFTKTAPRSNLFQIKVNEIPVDIGRTLRSIASHRKIFQKIPLQCRRVRRWTLFHTKILQSILSNTKILRSNSSFTKSIPKLSF